MYDFVCYVFVFARYYYYSNKMNSGYWLLAIGYWLLAIGYWLLAIGYWLLAIGYWLLAIGYRSLASFVFSLLFS